MMMDVDECVCWLVMGGLIRSGSVGGLVKSVS